MIPSSVIITSPDKTVSFSIKWFRIVRKSGAGEIGTGNNPESPKFGVQALFTSNATSYMKQSLINT